MQRLGSGMLVAACILGMAMLTTFFAGVEERQRNPNQNPLSMVNAEFVEVQLERNRQGHYLARGTINGASVEFLLDTGATDVVIPADLAGKLGLPQGRARRAMTANGAVTVYETWLDSLSVGELTLYNVRASINPGMRGTGILLGMSALREVEFTQRGDTLTLRQYTNRG